MAYFQNNTKKYKTKHTGIFSLLLVFALLIFLFFEAKQLSATTCSQQEKSLQIALNRCIIQCYTLEGSYPESLSYLEEHYGLTYDKSSFLVDYRPIASNIKPDVTIISRKEGVVIE